ncbi:HD-GYP domain-containing protein [Cohnella caldifontis]|uniref:HD-GYP domain-containing protein n=1 Tax=Cohnella caldifontis TaxID=3027471 RepID=UPI0023ED76A6|nr:HD-GYP domain-containing protein [Cohnella sp. YIM B05605]
MKELKLRDVAPGNLLARPVTGKTGVTMLESGTALTPQYIERLKNLGIDSVFVLEHDDSSVSSRKPSKFAAPQRPSRWELLSADERESKKNDVKAREAACYELLLMTESDRDLGNMAIPLRDDNQLRRLRGVFAEIVRQRSLAEELGVLYVTDHFVFQHSLRVGLLSGIIGLAKDYDTSRLYELVLGGLLFDIGMTTLPPELLRKSGQLRPDEKSLMRQHTTEGYRILTMLPDVSAAAAKCALLHHERYRGEGYPFGLKADDTPEFAQIVGLADIYDALTSPRHYRSAFTPGDAVEYLFAAGNYDFDMSLIWVFLKNVFVFPVASVIRLSNGQIGVVSGADSSLNHRPVVQIIREADGTPVVRPYPVDLAVNRNLTIVGAAPVTAE